LKKYKVCVYAISKNEEKFVERWVSSMSEADSIYVLDTGSTDKTVELLENLGVHVEQKIIVPWRFDVARNESLKLVDSDADICICCDLDEVFEAGWREKLEQIWESGMMRLGYNYNWKLDDSGRPVVNFYIEKIHSRHGYTWTHPVHEVLTYIGDGVEVKKWTDEITVNHYPDDTKSRGSYLPLLELSVLEDPEDDRNMHYLGREYMYYGKWNEAIDTLIRHLKLKRATWRDERCASMRFIARCYQRLNRIEEARMWLDKAILEAPHLRDPFMERAILEYVQENWEDVIHFCLQALEIKTHQKSYINEVFSWDYSVYDLLSLAYHYLGDKEKAVYYVKLALEMEPENERLLKNLEIMDK